MTKTVRNLILKMAISIIAKYVKYIEKKYYYESLVSHPVNELLEKTTVPEENKIVHKLKCGIYYFKTAQAAMFARSLLLQLGAAESFKTIYKGYEKYERN